LASILSDINSKEYQIHGNATNTTNTSTTNTVQKINTESHTGNNKIEGNKNASTLIGNYISYKHLTQEFSLIAIAGVILIGIFGFQRRRESD